MAPAALLSGLLASSTAGRLTLAQSQGTLWRGSGVLLLQHDTQFLPLGRFAWRLSVPFNFSGLVAEVDTGKVASPTQIHLSPWKNEIEIQRGAVQLPAQLLAVFAPQLTPYRLTGELDVSTDHFVISRAKNEGMIVVDWKQAASGLTDIAPLGDYRITLLGVGQQLNIGLLTQSGKLQLTGQGAIQSGQPLEFNGTAQAAPAQKEALSELLHHMGPEYSPGIFSFALLSN